MNEEIKRMKKEQGVLEPRDAQDDVSGQGLELVKDWGRVRLYRCVDEVNGYTIARYELEGKTYEIKDWLKRFFINKKVRAFPRWDPQKRRWIFWSWMAEWNVIAWIEGELKRKGVIKEKQRETYSNKKVAQRDIQREAKESRENYETYEIKSYEDLAIDRWTDLTIDYDIND